MKRLILVLASLAAAACGGVRYSGYPAEAEAERLAATGGFPPGVLEGVEARLASVPDDQLIVFWSEDLGPDTLDVSGYPQEQRANYALFRRVCSRCHTPARALFSPRTTATDWGYYVERMRRISEVDPARTFTPDEARAILAFLVYDSTARKERRRPEFEAQLRTLRRMNLERFIQKSSK